MPESHVRHGRKTPYSAIGIRRLPCFRCGQKATHQWNICADEGLYRPVCFGCDIALNRLVLRWMRFPDEEIAVKMKQYIESFHA